MAARGSIAKQEIIEKLLKTFEGSFLCNGNKELRIPVMENGELIQIKITLTAAKTNVIMEGDLSQPALNSDINENTPTVNEITEEEKNKVVDLLETLNLI